MILTAMVTFELPEHLTEDTVAATVARLEDMGVDNLAHFLGEYLPPADKCILSSAVVIDPDAQALVNFENEGEHCEW